MPASFIYRTFIGSDHHRHVAKVFFPHDPLIRVYLPLCETKLIWTVNVMFSEIRRAMPDCVTCKAIVLTLELE